MFRPITLFLLCFSAAGFAWASEEAPGDFLKNISLPGGLKGEEDLCAAFVWMNGLDKMALIYTYVVSRKEEVMSDLTTLLLADGFDIDHTYGSIKPTGNAAGSSRLTVDEHEIDFRNQQNQHIFITLGSNDQCVLERGREVFSRLHQEQDNRIAISSGA